MYDMFPFCENLWEEVHFSSNCEMQLGFTGGASGKEPACQYRRDTGDEGSIPRLGRSPGEGHGNPLQYSCLENPVDRGA